MPQDLGSNIFSSSFFVSFLEKGKFSAQERSEPGLFVYFYLRSESNFLDTIELQDMLATVIPGTPREKTIAFE